MIRFGYENNILVKGRQLIRLINRLIKKVSKRNVELAILMREGVNSREEDDMELLIVR